MNPESLVIKQGFAEPSLAQAQPEKAYQFEREGYFCLDSRYATATIWCLTAPSVCATHGRKSARSYPPLLRTPLTAAFFYSESEN
jgi:hypothetical protein